MEEIGATLVGYAPASQGMVSSVQRLFHFILHTELSFV